LLLIVMCLLLYIFFLPGLLQQFSGLSAATRSVITVLVIAIPAFLMGMPFPLGLRVLSGIEETNVPWAWGINSCTSVISASLAALLAAETGFSAVLMLAALAYTVSLLSVLFHR
jgi:hypothetical protein